MKSSCIPSAQRKKIYKQGFQFPLILLLLVTFHRVSNVIVSFYLFLLSSMTFNGIMRYAFVVLL